MSTPFRRKALIIGYGIAGPVAAMFFKRAGIDTVIYEAQDTYQDHPGMFMGLGPNGVNILKTLGVDAAILKYGFPTTGTSFYNSSGKLLGEIKTHPEIEGEDESNIIIKLSALQTALFDAMLDYDVPVEFGKRLIGIKATKYKTVIATFADGTEDEGDILVGCEGIHSRTRQIMLPHGPKPSYTGTMECGGVSFNPAVYPTATMNIIYGKQAYFGYFATPSGDIYWFSNFSQAKEPSKAELRAMSQNELRKKLLDLYRNDVPYLGEIIKTTKGEIGKFPLYELPVVPKWHKGPLCIAGDATHAVSPHVGHGASLAMEDAIVLAKCLRDIPDVESAFEMYEKLRKQRTQKIVSLAQHLSKSKTTSNPLAAWYRDISLPSYLERSAELMDWIYSYQVNWDEEVVARPSRYGKMFKAASRTMKHPLRTGARRPI